MGLKQTVFAAVLLLGGAGLAMAQSTAPSTTTDNQTVPFAGTSTKPNAEATGRQCVGAGGQQLHRRAGAPPD